MVGTGSIGQRHMRNLHKIFLESREPLSLHTLRHSSSVLPEEVVPLIAKTFYKWSEVDSSYDVIFVCTPTALHGETLKAALHFQADLFIEKPIYHHPDEHNNLQNALTSNRIVHVACPLRFHPVTLALKEYASTHQDICSLRVISSSWLPSWRPQADYRKVYSARSELGGGVALDLIHELDYIRWIFGNPKSFFRMGKKASDLEINVEDVCAFLLNYGTWIAEVHLDYVGRKTMRNAEVYGSHSRIDFDIIENQVVEYYPDKKAKVFKLPCDVHLEEIRYFINIIKIRQPSFNSPDFAVETLRLCLGN
jgi:predicted dehydrogenase